MAISGLLISILDIICLNVTMVFLKTMGTRSRKKSVLEGLGDEDKHAPDEYRMRLRLTFASADEIYRGLNNLIAIASSARNRARGSYDAY